MARPAWSVFFSLLAYWAASGSAVERGDRHPLSATEQLRVDNLLDNIMLTVQRQMALRGVDTQSLPNVSANSGQLQLSGTEGMIRGLTTIYRSNSAFAEYGNGTVSLSSSFSLQTLGLRYLVNAKYLFLSLTHDVGATVTYNSVKVRAGIFYQGDECYVGVQDVSVDMLDGIQWSTSGFGSINALVSAAINKLVPAATLKAYLNTALQKAMSGYKAQCYTFIPGLSSDVNWRC